MWNLLRRKNNKDRVAGSPPATQPENRVDELANTLNKEGRASEIELELKGLDRSSLSPAEQESWAHVYGIEKFIARQPLLFEPDMALTFHLLRYQERLKIRVLER